ncbi:G-protein coupled receptor GRL101 [Biomphalaria pfeifferi]|uniref:G-protein coupled receptor GRL101 n=1 Tax=Biomphalaria pfeifferi TaxID=112525 RepID=A0AAD8B1L1_BIOPF|nr:G-protein coupled receptor GRL101 [Biomphalaria pfeifferi]
MSSSDEDIQWRCDKSGQERLTDHHRSSYNSDFYNRPPSYSSSVSNQTEVKKRISDGNFAFSSTSNSSTETRDLFSKPSNVTGRTSLLDALEILKQQQEEIKRMQSLHDQQLQLILDSQPSLQHYLESAHQMSFGDQITAVEDRVPPLPPKGVRNTDTVGVDTGVQEETIYVQLERLYVNAKIFKTRNAVTQRQSGLYDDVLKSEICSLKEANKKLKEKIMDLEKKQHSQRVSSRLDLQVPDSTWSLGSGMKGSKSLSRLDDSKSDRLSTYSVNTPAVTGRPTSPVPSPFLIQDVQPRDMTFRWTINNYLRRLREERRSGTKQSSCPFHLYHCGYKARLEVYLNGNGTAKNRCISVFLRVVRGEYDRYLKWPVNLHLVVTLVNQADSRTDSLKGSGNIFQYQQPIGGSDFESDSWGLIEFVKHDVIKSKHYVRDDRLVLKCNVTIMV